jgi:glucarate dehydratase-related protein
MRIVPVAGYDSMLLNIGGAHNCYFTRIIVILTDSAGHTGVGETPCHASTLQLLEQFRPLIEGSSLLRLNATLGQLFSSEARQQQTSHTNDIHIPQMNPEKFYNAAAAIEAALLDLQGKLFNLPVADLLASGKQRDRIPVLGYLFYIADRQRTNMNYRSGEHEQDGWFRLRHEAAMDSDAVVRLAEAAVEQYGFRDFKLKGGVQAGEVEWQRLRCCWLASLTRVSPSIPMPAGRWMRRFALVSSWPGKCRIWKILAALNRAIPAGKRWPSFAAPPACRSRRT